MNITKLELLEKIIDLIEFHGFTTEDSTASTNLKNDLKELIYKSDCISE